MRETKNRKRENLFGSQENAGNGGKTQREREMLEKICVEREEGDVAKR